MPKLEEVVFAFGAVFNRPEHANDRPSDQVLLAYAAVAMLAKVAGAPIEKIGDLCAIHLVAMVGGEEAKQAVNRAIGAMSIADAEQMKRRN